MSDTSTQPVTRREWLATASRAFSDASIDSARLDAELLLTHALNISRTALHAHDDGPVPSALIPVLEAMVSLRVIRVPLAYIVGHREFYGRLFKVTPSVLIPRVETEDIVMMIKENPVPRTIIDVGTGSGALAVTLALEYPDAKVYGIDISSRALNVAENNDRAYRAGVTFIKGNLLADFVRTPLAGPVTVVANLPYVNETDTRSPETDHEPALALFARDAGMEFINSLIPQAARLLSAGDRLLLESNPEQQPAISAVAHENGFAVEQTRSLISSLVRL